MGASAVDVTGPDPGRGSGTSISQLTQLSEVTMSKGRSGGQRGRSGDQRGRSGGQKGRSGGQRGGQWVKGEGHCVKGEGQGVQGEVRGQTGGQGVKYMYLGVGRDFNFSLCSGFVRCTHHLLIFFFLQ